MRRAAGIIGSNADGRKFRPRRSRGGCSNVGKIGDGSGGGGGGDSCVVGERGREGERGRAGESWEEGSR